MGLGKRKDTANFTALVKYDARSGKFTRCDREQDDTGWVTKATDITDDFEAVFDLENVEVGWVCFTAGGAPDFRMVRLGDDIGERPSDKHREGFRVRVKLSNGAGDDVRELSSTAVALWNALDELHDEYLEDAKKHRNKLPVVSIAETKRVTTAAGSNYAPVFEITKWVPRPADLQPPEISVG
jgi:hypothetical protein